MYTNEQLTKWIMDLLSNKAVDLTQILTEDQQNLLAKTFVARHEARFSAIRAKVQEFDDLKETTDVISFPIDGGK
jgi:ssRNA-specific RNase YbeY (16S rRNA maturation enzyme)